MKIYYHKMIGGNIGDDLNETLWSTLIPNIRERSEADWLIGIGTILDGRIDALRGSKLVVGSGYRPSNEPRTSFADTHYVAVRGPLTARELRLDATTVKCDPGFLITSLYPRPSTLGDAVGLVPHAFSEAWSDITRSAMDIGLHVISPRQPVSDFIHQLKSCSRVLCESLHAAIFADALRIPWVRVKICSHYYEKPYVSDFKWSDAFSVLGLSATSSNRYGIIPTPRYRPRLAKFMRPARLMSEARLAKELWSRSQNPTLFSLSTLERLEECSSSLLKAIARLH